MRLERAASLLATTLPRTLPLARRLRLLRARARTRSLRLADPPAVAGAIGLAVRRALALRVALTRTCARAVGVVLATQGRVRRSPLGRWTRASSLHTHGRLARHASRRPPAWRRDFLGDNGGRRFGFRPVVHGVRDGTGDYDNYDRNERSFHLCPPHEKSNGSHGSRLYVLRACEVPHEPRPRISQSMAKPLAPVKILVHPFPRDSSLSNRPCHSGEAHRDHSMVQLVTPEMRACKI